jgi:hypothetical protein
MGLALLMLVSLFAGCNDNTPPVEGPAGQTPSTDKNVLVLAADGASEYRLVRDEEAKQPVKDAFSSIYSAVEAAAGVKIAITTDWEEPADKEILVGNTNRPASQKVLQDLKDMQTLEELVGDGFAIRVVRGSLIIIGTTDEATTYGVQYFLSKCLKVEGGRVTVSNELDEVVSLCDMLLAQDVVGSPLKKQFSDYVDRCTEDSLLSFDEVEIEGARLYEAYEIDDRYQMDGSGALRFTITRSDKKLTNLMWRTGDMFHFEVKDKYTATLKLWLFVDDDDKVVCDHDDVYGNRQEGQATFYFRAFDNKGRIHCWNHTLTGDGWHEIELTFNIHSGVDKDFDYQNITGFGMLVAAEKGTVIEIDDLRGVQYTTDYVPEDLPATGDRWITDGEYNAFDGAVIQEWYGCSYDLEDKKFGNSSLRCEGDNSVTDFRTIISNLNVPLNYQEDVLVFWMKVDKLNAMNSLLIELNQVQDNHEYEKSFNKTELQSFGLSTKDGEWCQITIPLSVFGKHLDAEKYGDSENITMYAFRFVVSGVSGKTYVVHLDRAYLTTKSALGMN